MNLEELKKPMVHKWRVQSANKRGTICIPYIDARLVQDRLDEVCTPANWQTEFRDIGGVLFCGISILIDQQWVCKWDCGTESNIERVKGKVSDSFKRAAVHWGIGRFLYKMKNVQLKSTTRNGPDGEVKDKNGKVKYFPADKSGKEVWGDISHLCNSIYESMAGSVYNPATVFKMPTGKAENKMQKVCSQLAIKAGVTSEQIDYKKLCEAAFWIRNKYPETDSGVKIIADKLSDRVPEFAKL